MTEWKKVDMAVWPRREHYKYYTEILKIQFNMTADVKVDSLLEYCHRSGKKFYPAMISLVTETVNSIENFRMFRNQEGELCIWDRVVPNYTVFHDDDKTFSDCWSECEGDFETVYSMITEDMKTYGNCKGIKAREGQPPNFFCVSCAPWTAFTAFSSKVIGGGLNQFFPVITMGKYEQTAEYIRMPVNLNVLHAVCDGYHAGLFFDTLQKKIDKMAEL